jgi:hypothetical protein
MPVLGALARWGHTWAWGNPRAGEAIDVGAIFRVAPGLLEPPASARGVVEFTVTERARDGGTCVYSLEAAGGRVEIFERSSADAKARVTATEADWVRALGPQIERDGLHVEGDERLAGLLLDGLARAAEQSADSAAA